MNVWESWNFSSEAENRLIVICSELDNTNTSKISDEWLSLLNYSSSPSSNDLMEVDDIPVNPKEEEILNAIKEALNSDADLPEITFQGISMSSLSRILMSTSGLLDEFRFCTFCKLIASWNNLILIEQSMQFLVLPKLKENKEASGCVIFSLKELAMRKPDQFSQNVLIPLLSDNDFQFSDVDLLSAVFPVLPISQQDSIILSFTKKTEFVENDWLLLHPLIKDLSQNSLLQLQECIYKFSLKFTKSQVFGRLLVNFCKNFNYIGNKDSLLNVIKNHQTLLKTQAQKYLECV